jgi:hypothetical protein
MIAKFEFDMEKPEDRSAFKQMTSASEMAGALYDVSQKIREWTKYGNREAIPLEEVREMFYETLSEHGLDLDSLYG